MSTLARLAVAAAVVATGALLILPAIAQDVSRKDGKTVVEAPTTRVTVEENSGDTRVRVRAPYAKVDVDTERGLVRIRVPYYSGDIRW